MPKLICPVCDWVFSGFSMQYSRSPKWDRSGFTPWMVTHQLECDFCSPLLKKPVYLTFVENKDD